MTEIVRRRPQTVFGIGLGRTGVTSLNRALTMLGWHVFQDAGSRWVRRLDKGDLKLPPTFDAAVDIPWPHFFRQLDLAHPKAKFILTHRPDRNAWLASVRWKFLKTERDGHFGDCLARSRYLNYGAEHFDADIYSRAYDEHYAAVRRHFAGRDVLLEFEVQQGWVPLCNFLERPFPSRPFPHENKRKT